MKYCFLPTVSKRLTAVAPIRGGSEANNKKGKAIAEKHIGVWTFHPEDHATLTVALTRIYIPKTNQFLPAKAKATIG